jgi:hypothetical protein
METIPLSVTGVFLATVAGVGVLWVWALRRAAGPDVAARRRWGARALAGGLAWLAVTGAVGASGILRAQVLPPPLLVLGGVSFALTVALALSPLGARLAAGLAPAWLVGYQAFRVPVEWVLYRLHEAGAAPVQMTFAGLNWDVLTGLSALPVAWLLARGLGGRPLALAWNLAGLGLLANIVTIAVLSAPTPLRTFHNEPANVFVTHLPFVWLPTVLVQAALLGHLLSLRALLRGSPAQAVAVGAR